MLFIETGWSSKKIFIRLVLRDVPLRNNRISKKKVKKEGEDREKKKEKKKQEDLSDEINSTLAFRFRSDSFTINFFFFLLYFSIPNIIVSVLFNTSLRNSCSVLRSHNYRHSSSPLVNFPWPKYIIFVDTLLRIILGKMQLFLSSKVKYKRGGPRVSASSNYGNVLDTYSNSFLLFPRRVFSPSLW